jgi:cobalamin biosynthesis Mg chelatase CobN
MDLELATIDDIVNELADRGLQFIIAIEVKDNDSPFKIHLCVDSNKNKIDVAQNLVSFFNPKGHDV